MCLFSCYQYINIIAYIFFFFHINSDYPFNIILQYLPWFEYIWAMLWLQWWNIPHSVYIVCLSNQSVNCIYFLYQILLFKLKTEKHHLHSRSIFSQPRPPPPPHPPPSFKVTFFFFNNFILINAAFHCFCKREMHLIVLKQILSSHSCYTHYITDVQIFNVATDFPVPLS